MKAWKLAPLAAALTSASAFAVEPVGMGLGNGLTFLPSVEMNVENNDNIYLQAKGSEVESTITRLSPSLALNADMGKVKWNASYKADKGMYSKDENDDYLDHSVKAAGQFELSSRYQLDLNASFKAGHDPRGSGIAEGANALSVKEADEFEETIAGGNFLIGADSAMTNFDIYAESYQKRYTNNKLNQSGQPTGIEDRDHNKVKVGAIAALNLSSATKALFELRQTGISYETDSVKSKEREGKILNILAGASWDITGKTTGELKIGSSTRSFDQSGIDSSTRFSWEGNVKWEPMTYSTVTLRTSQNANETSGAGNFIANTNTSIAWDHKFSTFISAGLEASRSSDNYVGDNTTQTKDGKSRKDEKISYGLSVTYSPMTWVDVKASLKQTDRNSNDDTLDYDTQAVNLGVTLAL